jgi:hypothetical protein
LKKVGLGIYSHSSYCLTYRLTASHHSLLKRNNSIGDEAGEEDEDEEDEDEDEGSDEEHDDAGVEGPDSDDSLKLQMPLDSQSQEAASPVPIDMDIQEPSAQPEASSSDAPVTVQNTSGDVDVPPVLEFNATAMQADNVFVPIESAGVEHDGPLSGFAAHPPPEATLSYDHTMPMFSVRSLILMAP